MLVFIIFGDYDVGWLHSPSPINYFYAFFARTVAEAKFNGKLHIMAVNTQAQHSATSSISGTHWFLAAWYIEPEEEV